MNSKITLFIFSIALLLFNMISPYYSYTDSDNPVNGRTGAPIGGQLTCSTGGCHSGPANGAGITISITGDPEYYIPGQAYEINMVIDDPVSTCYGFQMTAFDSLANSQGAFATAPFNGLSIETTGSVEYIEHNMISPTGVYTFDWYAPVGDVGDVNFYVCGVAGNCDMDELGDAVYLGNLEFPGPPPCGFTVEYDIDIYNLNLGCDVSMETPFWQVNITSITGGDGDYSITPFGGGVVSNTLVNSGGGFSYSFNQNFGPLGFEISDCSNNVCYLDQDLLDIFGLIPTPDNLCFDPITCNNNIDVTFATGDAFSIYSCGPNATPSFVVDVTGISGGDGSFSLTTLGRGMLSDTSTISGGTFSYEFDQQDINSQDDEIGFLVTDNNGCTKRVDFSGEVLCTVMTDYCAVLNCDIDLQLLSESDELCYLVNDGSAVFSATSSNGPINYQWLLDGVDLYLTDSVYTNLAPGNYSVIVTDLICDDQVNFMIKAADELIVDNCQPVSPLLPGGSDGEVEVDVSGGEGNNYTYMWDNGQTTNPAIGLTAGTYTVTVTDVNYCSEQLTCTVEDPVIYCDISLFEMMSDDVSCNAADDGSITIGGSSYFGGITYQWLLDGIDIGISINQANGLAAGQYTIIGTDIALCTDTLMISITEPEALVISNCMPVSPTTVGGSDGSLSVTVSGGTGNYNYSWSNAVTTPGLSNITAGSYTLTVTDENDCVSMLTCTVNDLNCDLMLSLTDSSNVTCAMGNDGFIQVNSSSSNGPVNYQWLLNGIDIGLSSDSQNDLITGNYTIIATDNINCSSQIDISLTQPDALLVANCTSVSPTIIGGSDGSINVQVAGGIPPYSFLWSDGQTTQMAINLSAGSYTITVTDGNDCTNQLTCTVTDPNIICDLTATAVSTDPDCFNDSNGTITISTSGGTAPFNFDLNNVSVNNTGVFTDLAAGIYNYTVTDVNNCSFSDNVTINNTPELIISSCNPVSPTIVGGNDGFLSVNVSGGTMPYNYSWSDGQTTAVAISLVAGNYDLTITDQNNCTANISCTVEDPDVNCNLQVNALGLATDCNNEATGSINLNASNGTSPYTYELGNGLSNSTGFFNGLQAGTYNFTVTDLNNCTFDGIVSVSQPDSLIASNCDPSNPSLPGASDGQIEVTVNGGTFPYFYNWSDGQTTNPAVGLEAGTYSVQVTDNNGCIASLMCTLEDPVACDLTTNINMTSDVSCFGGNDGSAIIIAMSSYGSILYDWFLNGQSIDETDAFSNNLLAGDYEVIMTDGLLCSESVYFTIAQPAQIFANCVSNNATGNNSDGSVSLIISGGVEPYTINWSNGGSGIGITDLLPGVYVATVTDNNLCEIQSVCTVGNDPVNCTFNISLANSTNNTCFMSDDGTASIIATNEAMPITYSWIFEGNVLPGLTTANATGLQAGNYLVTAVDGNDCSDNVTFTISQPTQISANCISNNATGNNNDGSISLVVSGGNGPYTIDWNNGDSGQVLSDLFAGSYTATITDYNSCSIQTTCTVGSDPVLCTFSISATNVNNGSCFQSDDGTATINNINAEMPITYTWTLDGNIIPGLTSDNATNLAAGSYTVQAFDADDCSDITSFVINEPLEILISCNPSPQTDYTLGSIEIIAFGGLPPYSLIGTGNIFTNNVTVNNLSAGDYTFDIEDSNDCPATVSCTVDLVLSNCDLIIDTVVTVNESCDDLNDGSANITANSSNGPIDFVWLLNGNTTSLSGNSNSNLSPGTYNIIITDNLNCAESTSFIIEEGNEINLVDCNSTAATNINNNDGTAVINVIGDAGPFSYLWPNGQTGSFANGLDIGIQIVMVTDAEGCTVDFSCNVPPFDPICDITASIDSIHQVLCNDGTDGYIEIMTLTSYLPLTYTWSVNGNIINTSGNILSNIGNGIYEVDISDAAGCSFIIDNITILEPAELFPLPCNVTDPTDFNNDNGFIFAEASGGTPPYQFEWSNGTFGALNNNLSPGIYSVQISDANGCLTSQTCVVNQFQPTCDLTINSTTSDFDDCNDPDSGNIQLNVFTTNSPITYQWLLNGYDIGLGGNNNSGLSSGTYTITAVDNIGCIDQVTVTLAEVEPIEIITCVNNAPSAPNAGDGSIEVIYTGGNEPVNILWSNGQTSNPAVNLEGGIYSYTITDVNGCTVTDFCILPDFGGQCDIGLQQSVVNPSCAGANDGMITLTSSLVNLSYEWIPDVSSTNQATNLAPGLYVINITDDSGCEEQITLILIEPNPITLDIISGYNCDDDNFTYSVIIEASGGIGSLDLFTSAGAIVSLGNNQFEVNSIPNGQVATAYASDFNNCLSGSILIGPDNCSGICFGEIGDIEVSGGLCYGSNISATTSNFVPGDNQNLYVIYHNSPNLNVSFPTTIYQVEASIGNFTSTLQNNGNLPETIYVTAVLAENSPFSFADLQETCVLVSTTSSININSQINASVISGYECNPANTAYSIQFDVEGGNGNYTISPSIGYITVIGQDQYQINDVPAGTQALIQINDSNLCGSINFLVGPFNCNESCGNQAGNIFISESDLCFNSSAVISTTGFIPADDQEVYIVFHSDPNYSTNLQGTLYGLLSDAGNFTNVIVNDGTWPNQFYATALIAESTGNNSFNVNDPCIMFGPTIVINMFNDLSISPASNYLCSDDGLSYEIDIAVTGGSGVYDPIATEGVVSVIGSNLFTLQNIPNGNTSSITISDNNGCFSNSVNVGPFDCDGDLVDCDSAPGTLSISSGSICAGNSIIADASGFILESSQQLFIVFHDSSDPSQNLPNVVYGISSGFNSNLTGILNYNNSLPEIFYVTAIAANTLANGSIDFNDPCLTLSETLTITMMSDAISPDDLFYYCNSDQTYNAVFTINADLDDYAVIPSVGNAILNNDGEIEIQGINSGVIATVTLLNNNGCSGSFNVGPYDCSSVSPVSIEDPCSCSDPNNYTLNNILYLFETITVMAPTGLNLYVDASNLNGMYDAGGTAYTSNLALTEILTGIYILNFWHKEFIGYTTIVTDGNFNLPISNSCSDCGGTPPPDDDDCLASTGVITSPDINAYCQGETFSQFPGIFGNNSNYDFIFFLTDIYGNILLTSTNGLFPIAGLDIGIYQISGLSYDGNAFPDVNVGNLDQLLSQDACFDLNSNAYTISIFDCNANDDCDAEAGFMQALAYHVYCTENLDEVVLPAVFGNNSDFDYLFLVTDNLGNIIATANGNDTSVDLDGLLVGTYCINGLSYDASSNNAPDLNVNNLAALNNQLSSCFDLTDDCEMISIESQTLNPNAPEGPVDTAEYCTPYLTPIDICFDIFDVDNQGVSIVSIITTGQATIESDNCINYPPLPGLNAGMSETISVIYCDDQCPALCDTAYATINIEEDCDGPGEICSGFYYACTEPLNTVEVCFDCEYTNDPDLTIQSLSSLYNGCTIEQSSSYCFEYTPLPLMNLVGADTVLVVICDENGENCENKEVYMTFEDCEDVITIPDSTLCEEIYYGCTPAITPFEFCLDCEFVNNQDIELISTNSLFNCGTEILSNTCMEYIPLPGMELVGADTVELIYCSDNLTVCDTAHLIMTFEDCGGLVTGPLIIKANDDKVFTIQNQPLLTDLLQNDVEVVKALTKFTIIENTSFGTMKINEDLSVYYEPEENFIGIDKLTYEVCQGEFCDRAETIIEVKETNSFVIDVFPNPTQSIINIRSEYEFDQIYILNASGKLVESISKDPSQQVITVDMESYPAGIYLLEIESNGTKVYKKIVKE